ncbi:site-specific integrase [Gelidibacter japonicus]|uniref:site-specific integrase n=1 Tax=Gelidibacter japonicus TaxID=1962232 RepID=UPI0013D66E68|nr:site-specific integrase [Gelidibacter japonicus]
MKTSNTFSILFWINASRAINKEAEIYARVTVNQKRVNISLKRKVNVDQWDVAKKRVKGHSAAAKQINQYLDQVYTKLFQIYQDLKFQEILITAELIKANYTGEGEQSKSLMNLIEYHHTQKIKHTHAKGSIRNFGVTESYLAKFLRKTKKTTDIYLKELDFKFLCDFESYLSSYWPVGHPRAMAQNTIIKHIQRLRKMVTLAYHMEWISKDPFVRWKPIFERKEREFLSDNELSNLENFEFPTERLDRVRDLFVFSCYTGISYVDIMNLTAHNILKGIDGNDWIITKRQKTNVPVKVPLLNKAEELIEKYRNHPMTQVTGSLLPIITNEKLNQYLKEVMFYVGIKKNLTFHMARHTFATTVTLSNGVPIETVSKLLGHSKISTTQIYAKVIERKVSDDMKLLKEKLNANNNERDVKSS